MSEGEGGSSVGSLRGANSKPTYPCGGFPYGHLEHDRGRGRVGRGCAQGRKNSRYCDWTARRFASIVLEPEPARGEHGI